MFTGFTRVAVSVVTITIFAVLSCLSGHGIAGDAHKVATALIELDGSGSQDPDGDTLTYSWRQVGGPRVVLSNPRTAKPYFRTSRPGRYLFSLTVSDGKTSSKPAIVEVLVERENLKPEAILPHDLQFTVNERVVIDGRKSRDADGDRLRYHWRQVSGPPLYINSRALRQPVLAFTAKQAGIYQFELKVSDRKASSAPAICRVVVKPQNQAPVARVIAPTCAILERPVDQLKPNFAKNIPTAYIEKIDVVNVGQTVTLDGRNSQAPGKKALRYYWKQVSGPFVRAFDRSNDAMLRFKAEKTGEYTFQLVVSDGEHDSEPALRKFKVESSNEPPISVVEAPACATTGTLVKLDGSHSYDKEGASLEYEWKQVAGPRVTNYTLSPDKGNSIPGFIPTKPGTYTFELVTFDGQNRSKPARVSIKVGPANHLPNARVASNLTVAPGEVAILQAEGEDRDHDRITYAWRQVGGPRLLTGIATQQSLTLTPTKEGVYTFEVVVSDGHSRSRPAICTLKVMRESADKKPGPFQALEISDPAELMLDKPGAAHPPKQESGKTTGKTITRFFQRFTKPLGKDNKKLQEPIPADISTAAPGIPDWAQ